MTARARSSAVRTSTRGRGGARVAQRGGKLGRWHLPDRRRSIGVADLERGALHRLFDVDGQALRLLRRCGVEQQRDPVRLRPDLVSFHRAEIERVLPAPVDGEMHRGARIGLERVGDDRSGGVAHVDLGRSPIRRLHTEHLVQLAVVEHLLHDVAATDEFLVDVELGDRRPLRKRLDALPDPLVFKDVERRVLRHQGIEDPDGGGGRKPHIGCIRVPFMKSTTRSDSMSDSIRDCNG